MKHNPDIEEVVESRQVELPFLEGVGPCSPSSEWAAWMQQCRAGILTQNLERAEIKGELLGLQPGCDDRASGGYRVVKEEWVGRVSVLNDNGHSSGARLGCHQMNEVSIAVNNLVDS